MLHLSRPTVQPERAFTLIELLVVIAVTALLIGILFPALASARRAARTTKCLAQLHNIELAHTLYMNDFKERFVDSGLGHGGIGEPSHAWPVLLAPYNQGPLALRSPSDTSTQWPFSEGGQNSGLSLARYLDLVTTNDPGAGQSAVARWTSYGLNNYLTASHAPPPELSPGAPYMRLAQVPRPHSTVHFLMMTFEGSFAVSDHTHVENWNDSGHPESSAANEVQTNAHGGKAKTNDAIANYSFLDGHAATLKFRDVYTTPTRNSFDPEVSP